MSLVLSPKPPSYERFYLDNRPLIDQVVTYVCRRYCCQAEEVRDFRQTVHYELIKDDYARLRKWEGRSSLKTFLVGVVRHLFQDYLIHLRGKRRTSEAAKRLGPVAEKLEELLRDYSFHEACEILLTNLKAETTREKLEDLACQLPPRPVRRQEGEEQLAALPSPELSPDDRLRAKERCALRGRILATLERARTHLPPDDQLFLRMSYVDGLSIATIARTTCQEQKRLYTRRTRILEVLRREFEQDGVAWADVADALGDSHKGGPESV